MNRLLVASLLVVGFLPGIAPAVEISNVRPRYGPSYGALRTDLKCLPGDAVFITYDIAGLNVDTKSGKVKYTTSLELLDEQNKDTKGHAKVVFSDQSTNEPTLQLGGGKMPGELYVTIGEKRAPGKYTIRLTVTDRLEKDPNKAGKKFDYPIEVLPAKFGVVGVSAPAAAKPGDRVLLGFTLVNFALDKKGQPRADISVRVLDEKGAVVDAVKQSLPSELPAGADFREGNAWPVPYPMYLNRPGRFTVEISAEDKNGNAKVELRFSFSVIDINALPGN